MLCCVVLCCVVLCCVMCCFVFGRFDFLCLCVLCILSSCLPVEHSCSHVPRTYKVKSVVHTCIHFTCTCTCVHVHVRVHVFLLYGLCRVLFLRVLDLTLPVLRPFGWSLLVLTVECHHGNLPRQPVLRAWSLQLSHSLPTRLCPTQTVIALFIVHYVHLHVHMYIVHVHVCLL